MPEKELSLFIKTKTIQAKKGGIVQLEVEPSHADAKLKYSWEINPSPIKQPKLDDKLFTWYIDMNEKESFFLIKVVGEVEQEYDFQGQKLQKGETVSATIEILLEPRQLSKEDIDEILDRDGVKKALNGMKAIDDVAKKLPSFIKEIGDRLPSEDRPFSVKLNPAKERPTKNLILNALIRYGTKVKFNEYQNTINNSIVAILDMKKDDSKHREAFFHSTNAYQKLVEWTDEFLQEKTPTLYDMDNLNDTGHMFNLVKDDKKLGKELSQGEIEDLVKEYFKNTPFMRAKARELGEANVIRERFTRPILSELIWSYWLEEGMLVQTMNAISLRFQNKSLSPGRDPLQNLDIDPLRPLGNLIWGYIQDEQHRLTVQRRAYEYDHHYGLRLYGKAVPTLQSADSRSKFLEAFHNLLYRSTIFFKEFDDMTVNADAFPLLNAIKELHLLLAEGMHNQYGDLPWTARREFFLQQLILSRPEMIEFLRGRRMMPYEEDWMGPVDAMKKLQGWTDVSITHFRNLATWGEQILLSIRHDTWNDSTREAAEAANWAVDWRDAIQGYIHAYRAVTGADLTAVTASNKVDATLPSILLSRRLVGAGAR